MHFDNKLGYDFIMAEPDDHALGPDNRKNPSAQVGDDLSDFSRKARDASALLKALAHEPRLMLLCLLAKGEKSVTELETTLAMRQPAVSQQLARLRMDGIVAPRREGKAIYYSLVNDDVRRIMTVLYDIFCEPDR